MIYKRQKTKKLFLALAMALVLPVVTSAQGLFRHGVADEDYYGFGGTGKQNSVFNRGVIETNGIIDNQTFGHPTDGVNVTNQTFGAPLGSGFITMLLASVGYEALKSNSRNKKSRKENIK